MTYIQNWRAMPQRQFWMLGALAIGVVVANIRQPYPEIAPLQHVPTVVAILAAPLLLARWPVSDGAVKSITLFLLLHTLAGRYTYSNVPYDAWGRALTGVSIDHLFGFVRNDFDRLVHFSFGLLSIRPFAEVMRRYARSTPRVAIFAAMLFVGAVSSVYEIFEWILTIVLAPGMADDYNGQQGDVWDSQKDMAIAILGGLLGAAFAWRTARSAR